MRQQVTESYFWQQVRTGLSDDLTHLCRIENVAGTGISDVNGCRRGQEVWIELKIFHGRRLYFRSSQRSWVVERDRVGGRVLVLARRDDQAMLYRAVDVVLAPHSVVKEGKSFHVDADDLPLPLYSCRKPFNWFELSLAIFNRPGVG
jgi:hypothetical protein